MKFSFAMIVKNEEEKLARCLDSVKKYVDEIIIVDTGSVDRTIEIAKSYGADIYNFEWCNDFAKARNYSIEKTSGDYVLVLDADNVLLEFPKDKILNLIKGKKVLGLAEIINQYTENGQKTVYRSYTGAIFPKEARYVSAIHEHIDLSYERVKLPISVFHDGYDNRDEAKFKRNIDILQNELQKKDDPYLLFKLAQEYKGLKQAEKANELYSGAYKTAERNKPYFPTIVVEYLNNLNQLKKYEKALELIENEEKNFIDFPEFYFMCGEIYMNLVLSSPNEYIQYFNKINESYEKCISIGESSKYQGTVGMGTFLPLHNLGAFYEVTGNIEKAKSCYKTAMNMGFAPSEKRFNQLNYR